MERVVSVTVCLMLLTDRQGYAQPGDIVQHIGTDVPLEPSGFSFRQSPSDDHSFSATPDVTLPTPPLYTNSEGHGSNRVSTGTVYSTPMSSSDPIASSSLSPSFSDSSLSENINMTRSSTVGTMSSTSSSYVNEAVSSAIASTVLESDSPVLENSVTTMSYSLSSVIVTSTNTESSGPLESVQETEDQDVDVSTSLELVSSETESLGLSEQFTATFSQNDPIAASTSIGSVSTSVESSLTGTTPVISLNTFQLSDLVLQSSSLFTTVTTEGDVGLTKTEYIELVTSMSSSLHSSIALPTSLDEMATVVPGNTLPDVSTFENLTSTSGASETESFTSVTTGTPACPASVASSGVSSSNYTSFSHHGVVISMKFDGDCRPLKEDQTLLFRFSGKLIQRLSTELNLSTLNIKMSPLACEPMHVDVRVTNLTSELDVDFVKLTLGNISFAVESNDELLIYNVSYLFVREGWGDTAVTSHLAANLGTYAIALLSVASFLFALLSISGISLLCRECYLRHRGSSFSLKEVPRVDFKMSDFSLIKIPRPRMIYTENSSQEPKPRVESLYNNNVISLNDTNVDKSSGTHVHPESIRVHRIDHQSGLLVGVTTYSGRENDERTEHLDNPTAKLIHEDSEAGSNGTANPAYLSDDDREVSIGMADVNCNDIELTI